MSAIDELPKNWFEQMETLKAELTDSENMLAVAREERNLVHEAYKKLKCERDRYRAALEKIAEGMCAGYCVKGKGHCSYPESVAKEALKGDG